MGPRADKTAELDQLLLQFIAGVVLYNQVVAQRLGLGASDAQFLSLLSVHGPMSPTQLAEASGLTSGTVSGVLDRLEERELILRLRDATDKRRVLIHPNPAGLERTAGHYAVYAEHTARVLSTRSVSDLTIIAQFLKDMITPPPASDVLLQ